MMIGGVLLISVLSTTSDQRREARERLRRRTRPFTVPVFILLALIIFAGLIGGERPILSF